MHLDGSYFDSIAATVAAIVALSLTLSSALGPYIMLVTESLKSAGKANDGKAGLVAIAVSVLLCSVLGFITLIVGADSYSASDLFAAVIVGAFVGVFVGAGAIRSYKTAVTIAPTNPPAVAASNRAANDLPSSDEPETLVPPTADESLNLQAATTS